MKTYQCHKQVQAAKILEINGPLSRGSMNAAMYALRLEGCEEPVQVGLRFIDKHVPEVGGYFVVYADGYQSYSPARAFEEGYHDADQPLRITMRDFAPDELAEFKRAWNAAAIGRPAMVVQMVRDDRSPVYLDGLLADLFGFGSSLPQKITRDYLMRQVVSGAYEIRPDGRTTLCELTFRSGATFRGESSCAVEAEFNAAMGEDLAHKDALGKAWGAYGVLLRELRDKAGL